MDGFVSLEKEVCEIRDGGCKPAYLLSGEEFWVREALGKLLDALIPDSDRALNLEIFDGASAGWEKAILGLTTFGLFPSPKVVVIERMPTADQKERGIEAALLKLLERGLPSPHVMVLTSEKWDPRRPLYKKIVQVGRALQFEAERDRSGQIQKSTADRVLSQALAQAQKRIEPSARELVLRRAGRALRPFAGEIEKLLLYVGEREVITVADVKDSFADLAEAWIFDLTEKVGDRSAEDSLRILQDLLNRGEHPLRLLATLGSELRTLLRARALIDGELETFWKAGMGYPAFKSTIWEKFPDCPKLFHGTHPYRAFLSMTRADSFSLDRLRRGFSLLHETDLALKTSSGDPERLIESLLIELCGLQMDMAEAVALK
jgi:DNA polymerase-3 subunit delta